MTSAHTSGSIPPPSSPRTTCFPGTTCADGDEDIQVPSAARSRVKGRRVMFVVCVGDSHTTTDPHTSTAATLF